MINSPIKFNRNTVILTIAMVFCSITGLILLSAYADKLVIVDRGIATWAKDNYEIDEVEGAFDSGFIKLINEHEYVAIIPAFVIFCGLILFDVLYLRLLPKQHMKLYLTQIVQIALYVTISYSMLTILKNVFRRPRPFQTVDFYPNEKDDLSCKLPFYPVFRRYSGANPCDYELKSCPSGHTLTMSVFSFAVVFLSVQNYHYTNQFVRAYENGKKKMLNNVFHLAVILMVALLTMIAIPSIVLARMSALKHFFTDVMSSIALSILFAFVFPLLQPEFQETHSYKQIDVINPVDTMSTA
ncbi:PAP2_superfamily protein [Hexamita inflata]|uniref:PAP2 superfamily protein n=1 Tax=Hexamita inflata TaxID=28002 RepID=A0AA86NM70_9EUKA|nr:PAP2 superfamily protein [Hexamita inflata]